MPEQLVTSFERWSKERGLVARDVDRARVARELLGLSNGNPIERSHIDLLVKKYRDGLMGARSVLAAKRVGEELLEWQAEVHEPVAEVSEPPPARPPEREAPARSASPDVLPAVLSSPPSELAPAGGAKAPSTMAERIAKALPDLSEDWGVAEVFKPRSAPPAATPSSRPPLDDFAAGEEADLSPPSSAFPDIDAPAARRPLSSRPPNATADSGSEAEPSPRRSEPVGRSSPPLSSREGRLSAAPSERLISTRPLALDGGGLGDVGLDLSKGMSSRPPPRSSQRPSLPASALLEPEPERPPPFTISPKVYGAIITFIAVFALTMLFILRPGCIFASSAKPVTGPFTSKFLGLTWEFGDKWSYAEDRDAKEVTKDGWTRRSSVFFQGSNANAYTAQIVVVTFQKDDARATEDDARQLGGNETLNAVNYRKCGVADIDGTPGTRCLVEGIRAGTPLGIIELYFELEGRAIFMRFSFELASSPMQEGRRDPSTLERTMELALADFELIAFELAKTVRPAN